MTDTSIKKPFVSNSQESTRMFQQGWMEILSKVHFTIPLVLYVPIVSLCLWMAPPKWVTVGLFAGGLFCWTLVEYLLHRFLFHFMPSSQFGQRLHFIFHGVHHDYPNDRLRLVMPPAVSIPLATLFFLLFSILMGRPTVFPFYAGFITGYLCYDMMHYSMHHLNWKNPFWQRLKQHHMLHHYQQPERGFGVSNPLWDYVFNTTFRLKK
ncbi:MAG: sterol desaturase family protein [Saprospiraceae bacterium]